MLAIQYIVVDGDFKIKCMFARASVQNRTEGKIWLAIKVIVSEYQKTAEYQENKCRAKVPSEKQNFQPENFRGVFCERFSVNNSGTVLLWAPF